MTASALKVLFLCTGNSCRSIMAEAALNHLGSGRFAAQSAGSRPAGQVHSGSLALLTSKGIPTAGLRSKSWDEFSATRFDIVITVCDSAAGEACPLFPGTPLKAHWGIPDPAHVKGSVLDVAAAFEDSYRLIETRIQSLLAA
jgi:arsenate reductase (thioredoxin)